MAHNTLLLCDKIKEWLIEIWRFLNEELCPTGHPKISAKAIYENVIPENPTNKGSENNFIDSFKVFFLRWTL